MTDGLFGPAVAGVIPALNSARRVVPIHSISFVDRSAEPWLRKIAEDSKGTYRHVDLGAPEGRLLTTWPARAAAVWILVAISGLASGDELVLRPSLRLKDKQIYSFDEDGVRFGPTLKPIGWDQIVRGTLAKDQARFDLLHQELSGPLNELQTKFADGAYASLLEPAETLFKKFAVRRSSTAYLVAQSLMWARQARHQAEDAIEPYCVCVTLRISVKDLSSLPGRRRLPYDAETGLSPELALVGFDASRAAAALPRVRERLTKLGSASPRAARTLRRGTGARGG